MQRTDAEISIRHELAYLMIEPSISSSSNKEQCNFTSKKSQVHSISKVENTKAHENTQVN